MRDTPVSKLLQWSLFATGFSAIVAEYLLSTLASYFIGNAIIQWTLVVSLMLFAMGLGSRLSSIFRNNLLEHFILLELALSLLVSLSSIFVFIISGFTDILASFIYLYSIVLGLLVGIEIPLVIRINNEHKSLRVNLASVLEKDYLGSLVGGIFFAFVALPIFGLTYTPFLLGTINFLVACVLLFYTRLFRVSRVKYFLILNIAVVLTAFYFAKPIELYSEQVKYRDKVVVQLQSKYQKVVVTEWNGQHWFYINGNLQFCSIDEHLYHEVIVHPAVLLHPMAQKVLVLGGGDGLAVRELLKHKTIESITLVDLDSTVVNLAMHHPIFTSSNLHSLQDPRVKFQFGDAFHYVQNATELYDIVIIDLPDPRSIQIARMYSKEFYMSVYNLLGKEGIMITQAGSPAYASKAYLSIEKTIEQSNFNTIKLHNHITSMGEWGWIIGVKNNGKLDKRIQYLNFDTLDTRWLNNQAKPMIFQFGKNRFSLKDSIEINTLNNPKLVRYYSEGNWALF